MTEIIPTYSAGSEAWHAQRRSALGGSEVAAVLGLSPFESQFALWHRKSGMVQPVGDRPEMEWGRRLESAIRDKWLDDHAPGAGHEDGEWVSEYAGETYLRDGWKLASPDWVVQEHSSHRKRIIEVKHPLYDDGWGKSGTDEVPVYYLCQARWYMHVLELPVCHFAVLFGGADYREYTVTQDADDVALMVSAGRAFLDSIADGVRPDIDGSDATYQVVRELHPDITPEHVEIPPELARSLVEAEALSKEAAALRQQRGAEVLDAMGAAKHADVNGWRVAFRTARTKADGTPGTPFLQVDRKAAGHLTNAITFPERTAS